VTIYHRPAAGAAFGVSDADQYVRFAEDQYRRLASYPAAAFVADAFDPNAAAAALAEPPRALARQACLGILAEKTAPPRPNARSSRKAR
jgi:hypothetical protein